ncbi:MAG: hypothetical protein IID38_05570 [Planctomycetes bacterium]|nr:hypothetical protein [Planctomycetota bacterium]
MDSPHARNADLPAYAKLLIRYKARQLARQRGFLRREEEDLRSELTVRLLAQLHRYDESRGSPNTFFDRVIETAAGMIARERGRLKRGGGTLPVSLDQDVATRDGHRSSKASQLTPLDAARRLGLIPDAPIPAAEVQAAIASLSPEDQAVCRALMTGTPSAAARKLGTSRRQIHNAMERIRRHFEASGLEDS